MVTLSKTASRFPPRPRPDQPPCSCIPRPTPSPMSIQENPPAPAPVPVPQQRGRLPADSPRLQVPSLPPSRCPLTLPRPPRGSPRLIACPALAVCSRPRKPTTRPCLSRRVKVRVSPGPSARPAAAPLGLPVPHGRVVRMGPPEGLARRLISIPPVQRLACKPPRGSPFPTTWTPRARQACHLQMARPARPRPRLG